MSRCELCGRETELRRSLVEGTELSICSDCGKFGKTLGDIPTRKIPKRIVRDEKMEIIVDNFGSLIKTAREKQSLKQADLARHISEKESTLHSIESGKTAPSIALARKLEKFLQLNLVEEYEDEKFSGGEKKTGSITLGDMVKIRKR